MTWNDVEQDTIRVFSNSLTPAARHHLELNYDSIRAIRAACERIPPVELARLVSKGIGWHTPANAGALLNYRVRREAGLLDDDNDVKGDA